MNKHQKGFTLIELVIVIVVLGVLAAVAIPKFLDMRSDAATAAAAAVAGAVTTAFANNYAAVLAQNAGSSGIASIPADTNMLAVINSVMGGAGLPTAYTAGVTAGIADAAVECAAGGITTISISKATTPTATATATLICTS